MQVTGCGKIKDISLYPALDATAKLMERAERLYFRNLLLSKAFREGVEVIGSNPAHTSVIGWVKFGIGYRLTPHQAAAVAIARRGTWIWGAAHRKKAKIHPLPTCKEPAEACLVGLASRIPDAGAES